MREEWRAIPGYAYEISNLGRVRSIDREVRAVSKAGREFLRPVLGALTSQQMQNCGYMIVHLYTENRRKAFTVHRLVAEAFIGTAPEGLDVNHKDGNKQNNVASNLEWMTRRENHWHAVAGGKYKDRAHRVRCPQTGREFDSITQAARICRKSHRDVRRLFERI